MFKTRKRENTKENWVGEYLYCIIINVYDKDICICMCFYNFLPFYTNRNAILHFFYVSISERDEQNLGEWRVKSGREERKYCIYTVFSRFIQIETLFICERHGARDG